MSIEIYEGSILDCDVDAIVNPANGFLNHGAGLARIIAQAAQHVGWSAQTGRADPVRSRKAARFRMEQHRPTVPTGGVAVTSAGVLPYKGIIHAVGPVWNGGDLFEKQLLAAAHDNAIAAARERGWTSIAFPAISCGLFRFPVKKAAPIAVACAVDWTNNFDIDIVFALMQSDHIEAYGDALEALS